MDEEAPMDLVDDRFDDCSIEDGPVDDNESFYADEECVDEEVGPTSENFRLNNRYKPSHHTPRELATIREENREETRSNTSSRIATRPPSVLSDKSNDFSQQFQCGGNPIEQYTENFYAKENLANRLFPESELIDKAYVSPVRDKQNSWEPSVCHYEKQPTPEIQTNSPGLVFGKINSRKEQKVNDENAHNSQRISPEKSIFATSPSNNSTRNLEAKTSTPKRPGGTNRLGHRGLPCLEISTIYESPQRSFSASRVNQSRYPTNPVIASSAGISNSDTVLSNRTVDESTVKRVLCSGGKDAELITALEEARKKRQQQSVKPNFTLNINQPKVLSKPIDPDRPLKTRLSATSQPANTSNTTTISTTQASHPKPHEIKRSDTVSELHRPSTTNLTNNMSRMSTAKIDSSRSSRNHGGFSDSSVSTVIANINSSSALQTDRDGRFSVNSMRTDSRASSTMTVGGTHPQATESMKPLRIRSKRMAFGVVQVNDTVTMELEIENISSRQCQVKSRLDSNTTVLTILENKSAIIDPKKSMKLRIAFTPTSIGRYQLFLSVEVPAQNFSQKIPIWGFGGVASIVPLDQHLHPTSNSSEFIMYSSSSRRFSFKLSNSMGKRDGFALITVYDSTMRQIPNEFLTFKTGRGVIVKKNNEREIDIRVDQYYVDHHDEDFRTSSAMSTASSMMSLRRRINSGADYVIQVCWGEEVLRHRLRLLAQRSRQFQYIDNHDFTSHPFIGEDALQQPAAGYPTVVAEDSDLFASAYRTFYINVFSSSSAYKAAMQSSKSGYDETVMETTAFRQHTFVNDVTILPKPTRRQ